MLRSRYPSDTHMGMLNRQLDPTVEFRKMSALMELHFGVVSLWLMFKSMQLDAIS